MAASIENVDLKINDNKDSSTSQIDNKLLNNVLIELRRKCSAYREACDDNPFLERAMKHLENLPTPMENLGLPQFQSWLKQVAQVILDVTYYEENKLVDDDFLGEESERKMYAISEWLEKPKRLIEYFFDEINNTQKEVDILGTDTTECLLWRRGALCYMYCSTRTQQPRHIISCRKHFTKCATDGALLLEKMISLRSPIQEKSHEVSTNDPNTHVLLQQGIYSDTHVLALMYCGELCYWLLEYSVASEDAPDTSCSGIPQSSSSVSQRTFLPQELGTKCLKKYIDIVKGPLKGQGWATDRAETLLQNINIVDT